MNIHDDNPVSPGVQPTIAPPEASPSEDLLNDSALWLVEDTALQIVHATRSWIQYGAVGFAVLCIVIGAVEGLLSR